MKAHVNYLNNFKNLLEEISSAEDFLDVSSKIILSFFQMLMEFSWLFDKMGYSVKLFHRNVNNLHTVNFSILKIHTIHKTSVRGCRFSIKINNLIWHHFSAQNLLFFLFLRVASSVLSCFTLLFNVIKALIANQINFLQWSFWRLNNLYGSLIGFRAEYALF